MSNDEYSNEPISIGELKSNKSDATAADWSPRDALVDMIRNIDKGIIKPSIVMILYDNTLSNTPHYNISCKIKPIRLVALGLLSRITHIINELK